MKLLKINPFVFLIAFFAILHLTSYGQSQAELNLKANEEYKKVDKEMNSVYQQILKEYASQPVFITKFKTAQRLWVQLRDAELAVKFPGPDYYGSVEPMCQAIYLNSLTTERIKFLKTWLNGIAEGDVCNGSVKAKL
jgi:uncharacterized protein YecT (DUF1311 family)